MEGHEIRAWLKTNKLKAPWLKARLAMKGVITTEDAINKAISANTSVKLRHSITIVIAEYEGATRKNG